MADDKRVLRSIETTDGGRCVDLFVRTDGTFGFEEYRRDVEDCRGWYVIGHHAHAAYDLEESALQAALTRVRWLRDIVPAVGPTAP